MVGWKYDIWNDCIRMDIRFQYIAEKDEKNKQISSGEITLNVICGGTKFISYMCLPRKTLPDIIDWLWVKVTWSLYICKTTKPLFRMFGTPEGRNCYIAIILRSSIKATSLYVLGRGTVCFIYHETRDKCVVNLLFASYKGQM